MLETEVVGLDKAEAIAKIEAAGLRVRITQEDDQLFPITMELRSDRINLVINKGKVTYADRG